MTLIDRARAVVMAGLLLCVSATGSSAAADELAISSPDGAPAGNESPPQSPTGASAGDPAAGMTIHIDPHTRQAAPPPPATVPRQLSPAEARAFSTSHDGLTQRPSAIAGGGVLIDLQGRFHTPLVGTVGASGTITIRHGEPTSAAPSEDETR